MTAALPAPLVPAEVDLTGFSSFMLDVDRTLASELVAVGTPEECWAAHLLMCRAWKQSPPASLPDDPAVLAAFSGAGKRWSKISKVAMRDFVKCSDGRLYHRDLAKEAVEAWERRKRFKDRSVKANERRWGSNSSRNEHGGGKEGEEGRGAVSQNHLRDEPRSIQEGARKEDQSRSKKDPSGPRQDKTGQDSSVLTDGGPSPPADPAAFRSVLDQPPLRLVPLEPEPAAPSDPSAAERELFARAKAVAGASFGGQVPKLLKAKGGNIALARAAVETASTKHNPREYLARIIRGDDTGMPPGQLYDRAI